jgi:hypothetical protein
MNIRKLTPQDAALFQRLRLIGLRDEPSAFANDDLLGVVTLGREGMRSSTGRCTMRCT